MLPRVWSVEEFQRHSAKTFSRRSAQLQAIDRTLAKAHLANPATEAGTDAIIAVLSAIGTWRDSKAAQGKTSGRARAVDDLQTQLKEAAETIYRRRVDTSRAAVRQDLAAIPKGAAQRHPQIPKVGAGRVTPTIRQATPQRNAAQDRLFDHLAQALIDRRQKVMAYDDEDLFDDLEASQKGRLAARWMLAVPREVTDVTTAKAEALRVIAAMLGNNVDVIKTMLSNNVEVVVIPRDKGMTVLDQFESIRGKQTFDGRSWDAVRGVGNVAVTSGSQKRGEARRIKATRDSAKGPSSIVAIDPKKNRIYTAITEENLLGGPTSAPGAGCYAEGYSTTTHEFAHSVHIYGLTEADRNVVDRAYNERLAQGASAEWVDGPREVGGNRCYASMNAMEYFAQLSNAWLGANRGDDPYTRKPRHNGKDWVRANEPRAICDLLDRVYGRRAIDGLNPAVILKS